MYAARCAAGYELASSSLLLKIVHFSQLHLRLTLQHRVIALIWKGKAPCYLCASFLHMIMVTESPGASYYERYSILSFLHW
jgi:hypothetical protein